MGGDDREDLLGQLVSGLDIDGCHAARLERAVDDTATFDGHGPAEGLEFRRGGAGGGEYAKLSEVLDFARGVHIVAHFDSLAVLLNVARQVVLEISHPVSVNLLRRDVDLVSGRFRVVIESLRAPTPQKQKPNPPNGGDELRV